MIRRGEVWWVDLGVPRGSAPGRRRPVLVVSSDAFNRSRIATVACVAITSNLRLADAPGNIALDEGEAGLPRASVANVSQVVTVDKADLEQRLGAVAGATLRAVDTGLRRALGL